MLFGIFIQFSLFHGIISKDSYQFGTESSSLWPAGIVPYEIGQDLSDQNVTRYIKEVFTELETFTCLRFVERTDEADFVYVVDRNGCFSYVGREGGKQDLSASSYCFHYANFKHEMLHLLGFDHEQSRFDSHDFIRVNTSNIAEGGEINFARIVVSDLPVNSTPYDYSSVSHYSRSVFGTFGPTMTPIFKTDSLGQRYGYSQMDLIGILKYYRCDRKYFNKVRHHSIRPPLPIPQRYHYNHSLFHNSGPNAIKFKEIYNGTKICPQALLKEHILRLENFGSDLSEEIQCQEECKATPNCYKFVIKQRENCGASNDGACEKKCYLLTEIDCEMDFKFYQKISRMRAGLIKFIKHDESEPRCLTFLRWATDNGKEQCEEECAEDPACEGIEIDKWCRLMIILPGCTTTYPEYGTYYKKENKFQYSDELASDPFEEMRQCLGNSWDRGTKDYDYKFDEVKFQRTCQRRCSWSPDCKGIAIHYSTCILLNYTCEETSFTYRIWEKKVKSRRDYGKYVGGFPSSNCIVGKDQVCGSGSYHMKWYCGDQFCKEKSNIDAYEVNCEVPCTGVYRHFIDGPMWP